MNCQTVEIGARIKYEPKNFVSAKIGQVDRIDMTLIYTSCIFMLLETEHFQSMINIFKLFTERSYLSK